MNLELPAMENLMTGMNAINRRVIYATIRVR
jgi:hypothetical protein